MHFTTIVSSLLLAGSALAQDSSASAPSGVAAASGSAPPTSTGGAGDVSVQVVKVGSKNGSKVFEPNDIQAAPGTMIQFQFWPQNHSVVQSTFDAPCMPINMNQPNVTGLYSGFMPVSMGDSMMPTYTVMVNDTKPLWLYCSQQKHCQGGMVMAVNAKKTGEKTLKAYKQLASAAAENLSPGQMPSAGAGSNSTVPSGSASPSSGAGSSSGGSSSGGSSGGSSSGGSSSGSAGSSASSSGSADSASQTDLATGAGSSTFKNVYSSAALAGFISAAIAFTL